MSTDLETCFACHKAPTYEAARAYSDPCEYEHYRFWECKHCGYKVEEIYGSSTFEPVENWNAFQVRMKKWLKRFTSVE